MADLPNATTDLQLGQGRLLRGDCLNHLRDLAKAQDDPARFHLIYVDPPFAAGGKRGARQSTGSRDEGKTAYADNFPSIDAWLEWFRPRLAAMGALLEDSGSLWLHLDHRAIHEAKVLADSLFGRKSFRGEIIWAPGNGARSKAGPSVTHQTILVYAPGGKMIWNVDDPILREPFADTSLRTHFRLVDNDGRRYRERKLGGKSYRYYADEGRRLGSIWTDCPSMSANTPLTAETTGYPTQKPERLLERIIKATTQVGDRVLDPMCGSGTTLAVARRLGRAWLGIDQSPISHEVVTKRLALTE